MSRLVAVVSSAFGVSPPVAAFWIPAVAGGLVSVACALWGNLLGGWAVALGAGLVGGVAPGFWYRTRLGYYDTDIVTLLVPLVVGLMLAWWVRRNEV
jgi:dolichyl-diphosphooligosaccharide--protein glycosyltransferase